MVLLLEVEPRTCVLTDIVYMGVLHTEHWRVGLLFLKAGKNVLCEKPFAMNSRQVKDLVATAKKSNVFLMEVWLIKDISHLVISCIIKLRGHLLAVQVTASSNMELTQEKECL